MVGQRDRKSFRGCHERIRAQTQVDHPWVGEVVAEAQLTKIAVIGKKDPLLLDRDRQNIGIWTGGLIIAGHGLDIVIKTFQAVSHPNIDTFI